MILIWGHRLYGRIYRSGSTYLATRFFHLWYLPLIPLGSQLVLEEMEGGQVRCISSGISLPSLLAGYLRIWGIIACLITGGVMLSADLTTFDGITSGALPFAIALGATGWAWLRLGRLSQEELAQREVYERWCGLPIDPGLLSDAREGLANKLTEEITRLAGEQGALGYRGAMPSDADLLQTVARLPDADSKTLSAALTLARIERSRLPLGDRAGQKRLDDVHAQLWYRISKIEGRGAQAKAA